jgi:hypothetical protein
LIPRSKATWVGTPAAYRGPVRWAAHQSYRLPNVIDRSQVRSGTTEIAPAGHSATQRLQPLQKS